MTLAGVFFPLCVARKGGEQVRRYNSSSASLPHTHTCNAESQASKTYILRCGCDEMCLRLSRHAARTPKERKEPSAATFYLILRLILLLSR